MKKISTDEIKQDVVAFLHLIEEGDTFLIMQGDDEIAEVTPFEKLPAEPRPFGLAEGQFVVPDDIIDPLPAELWTELDSK